MTDKPKTRWFQFRLRTLLLIVAVLCVPLAWVAWRMEQKRQERAVIAAIERLGGVVMYEWQGEQVEEGFWLPTGDPDAEPTGSHWLRQVVGDDFFSNVVFVALSPDAYRHEFHRVGTNHPVADDDLRMVGTLSKLEGLDLIETEIGNAGLVHLQGLANLRCLMLYGTNITDTGLSHLRNLTALRVSYLGNTRISDAGLQHLKSLTGLKSLALSGTKSTRVGVDDLAKALPDCEILGGPFPPRSATSVTAPE